MELIVLKQTLINMRHLEDLTNEDLNLLYAKIDSRMRKVQSRSIRWNAYYTFLKDIDAEIIKRADAELIKVKEEHGII